VGKEAKSLSEAGYHITIFAWDRECGFPPEERIDNIRVSRIRVKSSFGRGLFQMGAFLRFWWNILVRCLRGRFDVIHCSDLDTLIPGLVAARLRRSKLVFDAHELYPYLFSARFGLPVGVVVTRILQVLERFMCLFADRIITTCDYLRVWYERYGRPVTILYNCPSVTFLEECEANFPSDDKSREKAKIVHVGCINMMRGADKIPDSLAIVRRKFRDVLFLNLGDMFPPGDYVETLRRKLVEEDLCDSFIVTGWINHSDIARHLGDASMGVILYQPRSFNNVINLPNKLFEYMAAGIPVVASDFVSTGKIVNEEKCGLLVDPTDPKDIAEKMLFLLENPDIARRMGLNGRRAAVEKYNWEMMRRRLLAAYGELLET
jgi:glycosyltransferase involved in cell wall biosynthesis